MGVRQGRVEGKPELETRPEEPYVTNGWAGSGESRKMKIGAETPHASRVPKFRDRDGVWGTPAQRKCATRRRAPFDFAQDKRDLPAAGRRPRYEG